MAKAKGGQRFCYVFSSFLFQVLEHPLIKETQFENVRRGRNRCTHFFPPPYTYLSLLSFRPFKRTRKWWRRRKWNGKRNHFLEGWHLRFSLSSRVYSFPSFYKRIFSCSDQKNRYPFPSSSSSSCCYSCFVLFWTGHRVWERLCEFS